MSRYANVASQYPLELWEDSPDECRDRMIRGLERFAAKEGRVLIGEPTETHRHYYVYRDGEQTEITEAEAFWKLPRLTFWDRVLIRLRLRQPPPQPPEVTVMVQMSCETSA